MWLLATLPIAAGFELQMRHNPSKAQEVAYTLGFILMMTLWGIAMTIWMMARSEIVDLRK